MPEKIEIENVNIPGRTERVDHTKYMAMRKALLAALPDTAPGMTVAEAQAALLPAPGPDPAEEAGRREKTSLILRKIKKQPAHKAEVMAEIESAVAGLEGLCAARSEASAAEVYRLASRILDLAGFFDTGPLFDAGYSLADVSDRMATADAWDGPPVQVHVQALRLILKAGCERNAATDHLLAGLKAVAVKARA